ncbi:MAG TPA: DNA repair protein RecO [Sedimenticola sp.]|nr:DNA repair protein RecO [Sedimenticola sp.]
MPHHQLQPAFLLHRRPYSNSSLLIECFAAGAGRFPAIARGVATRRGQGLALLQPFNPLLIGWSGRGEVKSLNRYEAAASPLHLTGEALYCGFYLNELLMRLLQRGDPQRRLFALYGQALEGLAGGADLEPLLRRFELSLLEEIGFGLILDREGETDEPLQPDRRYHYHLERGPLSAPGDGPVVSGATLLALAAGDALGPDALQEARGLLRHVLACYLGDRPLHSRELFRAAARNQAAPD